MAGHDVRLRAFAFAGRVIRLSRHLARLGATERVLGHQLLRSGTSIGANLEEATAAQSRRDFASRCRIALKEARESHYWLRLIQSSCDVSPQRLRPLTNEANELISILTAIVRKASEERK